LPKSFLANTSSREVSGKISSSSQYISTTKILSEVPSCSYIGVGDQLDETSGREPGGGGDPDGDGGGIEALPDEEDSSEGERERLMPLLSSIVNK
jgi:hypothetical protein